jgi:RNA polymerase sigma-70 factor (ECF subfamily)
MTVIACAFAPSQPSPKNADQELTRLIRAAAEGDQIAFGEFYNLTNRSVFGLSLRILGDQGAAEEVTLDVYLQVWKQAKSYNPDRGRPTSWLMMMARSRAIDRIRGSKYVKHETETLDNAATFAENAEDPEEESLFAERRRIVRAALKTLPPEQRQVIEAAFFSGLSQSELAARLGVPLGTVKTRMRSGMIRLRRCLTAV